MTELQKTLLARLPHRGDFSDGSLTAMEKRTLAQLTKLGYVRRSKLNALRHVMTKDGEAQARYLRYAGAEPSTP